MSQKISTNTVLKKCQKAGINFWLSAKAAIDLEEKLEEKEGKKEEIKISEEELNREIHSTLEKYNKEAAERFRSYHSISVRTTDGELQPFDKNKIIDSLLKETKVPRRTAKEISDEISEDIRRLQLHNISSSLIREMVNTKLLQRRQIEEKRQYTRIGIPIHDAKQIITKEKTTNPVQIQEKFSNKILEEYTLNQSLPKELSQEHLKGKIYIHSLSGFITSPESIENDLYKLYKEGLNIPGIVETGPAKKPEVAASHAARNLLTSSQYTSEGVSINSFNFYIAPYLEEKNLEQIEQVAQTFLYELNQLSSGTKNITVNLDTNIPHHLKEKEAVKKGEKLGIEYKEYKEEAEKFLKEFIKVYKEGDYQGNRFKTPKLSIKYREDPEEKIGNLEEIPGPLYLVKQEEKNSRKEKATLEQQTLTNRHKKRGIIQTVSLNLPSYPTEKESRLYREIRKQVNTVEQIIKKKKENLSSRKEELQFLEENHTNPEKLPGHISIYGLIRTAKNILGEKEHSTLNSSTIHQSKKIIREIKKQINKKEVEMKISQKPNQKTTERFKKEEKTLLRLSKDPRKELNEIKKYLNGGTFLETDNKNLLKQGHNDIKLTTNL